MTVVAERVDEGRHEEHTDLALVGRLRAHDTAALETLMERHSSRIYRVAFGSRGVTRRPKRSSRTCS